MSSGCRWQEGTPLLLEAHLVLRELAVSSRFSETVLRAFVVFWRTHSRSDTNVTGVRAVDSELSVGTWRVGVTGPRRGRSSPALRGLVVATPRWKSPGRDSVSWSRLLGG